MQCEILSGGGLSLFFRERGHGTTRNATNPMSHPFRMTSRLYTTLTHSLGAEGVYDAPTDFSGMWDGTNGRTETNGAKHQKKALNL